MTEQYDLLASLQARDEGIEAVTLSSAQWHAQAIAMLRDSFHPGDEGTGEDFLRWMQERGLPEPPKPQVVGAMLMAAARSGLIAKSGSMRPMRKKSSHGRGTYVWVRL